MNDSNSINNNNKDKHSNVNNSNKFFDDKKSLSNIQNNKTNFFKQYISCLYCNTFFNNEEKKPQILLCGHNICAKCVKINKNYLTCIDCNYSYDNQSIKDIPVNFVLENSIHKILKDNPFLLEIKNKAENSRSLKTKNYIKCLECNTIYKSNIYHEKAYPNHNINEYLINNEDSDKDNLNENIFDIDESSLNTFTSQNKNLDENKINEIFYKLKDNVNRYLNDNKIDIDYEITVNKHNISKNINKCINQIKNKYFCNNDCLSTSLINNNNNNINNNNNNNINNKCFKNNIKMLSFFGLIHWKILEDDKIRQIIDIIINNKCKEDDFVELLIKVLNNYNNNNNKDNNINFNNDITNTVNIKYKDDLEYILNKLTSNELINNVDNSYTTKYYKLISNLLSNSYESFKESSNYLKDKEYNELNKDLCNYFLNNIKNNYWEFNTIPFISIDKENIIFLIPKILKVVYFSYNDLNNIANYITTDNVDNNNANEDIKVLTYDLLCNSTIVSKSLEGFYLFPLNSSLEYFIKFNPCINFNAKLDIIKINNNKNNFITKRKYKFCSGIYHDFKVYLVGIDCYGNNCIDIYYEITNTWENYINKILYKIKWYQPVIIGLRYSLIIIDRLNSLIVVDLSSENNSLTINNEKIDFNSSCFENDISIKALVDNTSSYCILNNTFSVLHDSNYEYNYSLIILDLNYKMGWIIDYKNNVSKINSNSNLIKKLEDINNLELLKYKMLMYVNNENDIYNFNNNDVSILLTSNISKLKICYKNYFIDNNSKNISKNNISNEEDANKSIYVFKCLNN